MKPTFHCPVQNKQLHSLSHKNEFKIFHYFSLRTFQNISKLFAHADVPDGAFPSLLSANIGSDFSSFTHVLGVNIPQISVAFVRSS
jgi:hypothetical protein